MVPSYYHHESEVATELRFFYFPPHDYFKSMLLIEYILLGLTVLYLGEMIFFRLGLERNASFDKNYSYQPNVSIIVAARNEERNIGECLAALVKLDYLKEKFEIIIVDDGSTDQTSSVVQEYSGRYPHVKLISAESEVGNLRGKANALSQGIAQSRGEILMFTDADCTVPEAWLKETVSYYTEGVAVVAGFTFLVSEKSFDAVQAIDWFFLYGVAAATAGWNIPLTGVGNNLSVRRSAYDRVGGYRNLRFSVTEDYALVQAIWQTTRMRVRYPLNLETLVQSKPCASWKELYRQKQRWGVGGLEMVLRGFLLMAVHFAMHLSILVGFILASPWVLVTAIAGKFLGDLLFLWKPIYVFKKYRLLNFFLLFELYYSIYELLIPFVALLSKRVVWKERAFKET